MADWQSILERMFYGDTPPPQQPPMGGMGIGGLAAPGGLGGTGVGLGALMPGGLLGAIFGAGKKPPPPQQPEMEEPPVEEPSQGIGNIDVQKLLEALLSKGKGDRQDVPGKENRLQGPPQGPPGTGVGATEFMPGYADDLYLGQPRGLGLMPMWGQATGYGQPKLPGGY